MSSRSRIRTRWLIWVVLAIGSPPLAAQVVPLTCSAVAAASPLVRAEGLTELVGDLVLTSTGGTPTLAGAAVVPINLQLFFNVNVTSRILAGTLTDRKS